MVQELEGRGSSSPAVTLCLKAMLWLLPSGIGFAVVSAFSDSMMMTMCSSLQACMHQHSPYVRIVAERSLCCRACTFPHASQFLGSLAP